MSSFFKNIAVTYWTGQIYNDTNEDMLCEIEEEFSSPLVDAASNYVCAVERMELSGNNIFFYDTYQDPDAKFDEETNKYYTTITFTDQSWTEANSAYKLYLYGSYFSLASLIDALNNWGTIPDDKTEKLDWAIFTLTPDGKIQIIITDTFQAGRWGSTLVMYFDSAQLASIFGLPKMNQEQKKDPTEKMKAKDWWQTYSDYTWYGNICFQTKSSRVDCGIIPTMVQLRSTLPFESDQVSSTKTNIVTDFNIVPGSASDFSLQDTTAVQVSTTDETIKPRIITSTGITQGCGGMLIYTPAERRWLNFSAPVAIYNMRLWIELIYNDPDQTNKYFIPPGGKFSIKLGLYLRSG